MSETITFHITTESEIELPISLNADQVKEMYLNVQALRKEVADLNTKLKNETTYKERYQKETSDLQKEILACNDLLTAFEIPSKVKSEEHYSGETTIKLIGRIAILARGSK